MLSDDNGKYKNYKVFVELKADDTFLTYRRKFEKKYGYKRGTFIVTWILNNRPVKIFSSADKIQSQISMRDGVLLLFEIPQSLSPKVCQPYNAVDSNYGIDSDWVKTFILISKARTGIWNLPRMFWVHKSWSCYDLHLKIFDFFKNLFHRWYEDYFEKNNNRSDKSKQEPKFKHPDTKKTLNFDDLKNLFKNEPLSKQFLTFFPQLTLQNSTVDIGDNFDQDTFPYKLCLEQKNILPNLCCYCNQTH